MSLTAMRHCAPPAYPVDLSHAAYEQCLGWQLKTRIRTVRPQIDMRAAAAAARKEEKTKLTREMEKGKGNSRAAWACNKWLDVFHITQRACVCQTVCLCVCVSEAVTLSASQRNCRQATKQNSIGFVPICLARATATLRGFPAPCPRPQSRPQLCFHCVCPPFSHMKAAGAGWARKPASQASWTRFPMPWTWIRLTNGIARHAMFVFNLCRIAHSS